jgi:tRNA dimethylallyltransferase
VGGTGQYIKAVIEGWQPPNQPPDLRLRQELERWGTQIGRYELHRRLAALDPAAADFIDPGNLRRTVRAIEVILSTGRRFSAQRQRSGSPYDLMKVGLTRPRAELYARIDDRIDAMLRAGLVDEVRSLLGAGYSADLPAFSAIGYRQIVAHLRGEISLEEAVLQMKRLTRRYVRQQGAWFREEDESIQWYQPGETAVNAVVEMIQDWLADDRSVSAGRDEAR